MGRPLKPFPVKWIVGLISSDPELFKILRVSLSRRLGPVDFESPVFDFDQTDYYTEEMGKNLKRIFLAFKKCGRAEKLPSLKLFTNKLEMKYAKAQGRIINLDPGYVTLAKLVLATTKNHGHRLYLDKGIFGEVTLSFHGKSFETLDWTYPDFRANSHITFFNRVRGTYKDQMEHDYGPSELYRSL